jgi:hypothetical protein
MVLSAARHRDRAEAVRRAQHQGRAGAIHRARHRGRAGAIRPELSAALSTGTELALSATPALELSAARIALRPSWCHPQSGKR